MATSARSTTARRHAEVLNSDYDHLFKLVVVGDSGVGKSSLVQRFTDDIYHDTFISTIGVDFNIRSVVTDKGKKVKLQIWDTAGQDRFRAMTSSFYRGGNGIVLCYDTTDAESFRNMSRVWLKEIADYAREDVRVVIVGTKADLADARRKARTASTESKDRSEVGAGGGVSRRPQWAPAGSYDGESDWDEEAEATALAEELGVPLFRCSAKTAEGVEEVFARFASKLVADRAVGYGDSDDNEPRLGGDTIRVGEEGLFSKLGCFC